MAITTLRKGQLSTNFEGEIHSNSQGTWAILGPKARDNNIR